MTVVLSVRDRGLGIPEEHRAHIFDRVPPGARVAYRSGLGLGLHISREIVLLLGGKITVAFPVDGGSRFTVSLHRGAETPAGTDVGYKDSGGQTSGRLEWGDATAA